MAKSLLFRGLPLVGCAFFSYCTAVQFNDPDAWIWISIYGIAGVLCLLATLGKLWWPLPWTLGLACLGGAVWLARQGLPQQSLLESEEGRELLGLVSTAGWMYLVAVLGRRKPPP